MRAMTDEFNHHALSSVGLKKENDAFYSNDSKGGRNGDSRSRKNVECFNCGNTGHYRPIAGQRAAERKAKGKGVDKGKEEDAAAVAKTKEDEDATWSAMAVFDAAGRF